MQRSRAMKNFMSIGDLIAQLEYLYNQVKRSCRGLDNYLTGNSQYYDLIEEECESRLATFSEEMQLISIFLKFIGKEMPTEDELELYHHTTLSEYMGWFEMPVYLEKTIKWLQNILSRCRQIQNVVQRTQQRFLERRYAPGGPMYRQAQQRFSDRSSLTQ